MSEMFPLPLSQPILSTHNLTLQLEVGAIIFINILVKNNQAMSHIALTETYDTTFLGICKMWGLYHRYLQQENYSFGIFAACCSTTCACVTGPAKLGCLLLSDGLVSVHVSLLLQYVQPFLHRLFVLEQCALILLRKNTVLEKEY